MSAVSGWCSRSTSGEEWLDWRELHGWALAVGDPAGLAAGLDVDTAELAALLRPADPVGPLFGCPDQPRVSRSGRRCSSIGRQLAPLLRSRTRPRRGSAGPLRPVMPLVGRQALALFASDKQTVTVSR